MRSVTYVLLISTGLMATPSTLLAGAGDLPYKIDNNDFDPATLIWHTEYAEIWEDALPVGNGRLGAMVYGGVEEERIQLNEDTYWSGGPYNSVVEGGGTTIFLRSRNSFSEYRTNKRPIASRPRPLEGCLVHFAFPAPRESSPNPAHCPENLPSNARFPATGRSLPVI